MFWFEKIVAIALLCNALIAWMLVSFLGIGFLSAMALWMMFSSFSAFLVMVVLVGMAHKTPDTKTQQTKDAAAREAERIEMFREMLQRHRRDANYYGQNGWRPADQVRPQFDPYATLEVRRDASWKEIQKAYRRNVRQYHPDVAKDGKGDATKFTEVIRAYEYLEMRHKAKP